MVGIPLEDLKFPNNTMGAATLSDKLLRAFGWNIPDLYTKFQLKRGDFFATNKLHSLKLTLRTPENSWVPKKGISSSNHPFSGAFSHISHVGFREGHVLELVVTGYTPED